MPPARKQRTAGTRRHAARPGRIGVRRKGAIATVTLYHAGRLNAVCAAMWRQLATRFDALSADPALRCVVIRGAGDNFSAGADVSEFMARHTRADRAYHYHQELIGPALRAIEGCVHPTIARVQGICVGGGFEIACCCDLRIAGESARVGMPVSHLGFPIAPAELRRLLAVAGPAVMLELLLEGRILGAAEACRKGLISRVVADADVARETHACAEKIATGAPIAARLNKRFVRRFTANPAPVGEPELRAFFEAWAESRDHREGVRAFLEKRRPEFRGEASGANGT
jgi:enoyl-CoA hydratase